MKNKLIFTGMLSLLIFGVASCSDTNEGSAVPSTAPSTTVPSTTAPSTTVVPEERPLEEYYNGLDTTKTGKEFVDKLSIIINRGYQRVSYDDAYDYLTITDADPLNPGNVICFYTGVSYKNGINGNDRLWNREHVWAKSHGFNEKKFDAYSDLHHLRATEKTINSTRNNKDFDNVNDGGSDNYGNKWNDSFFEPRDEVKGDVARILFYMSVKYSSGDLKLTLTDEVPTGSSKGEGKLGRLSTLIKWHEEDPVSIEEVKRNEEVYKIQKNRNPFIDHPEFAENVFNVDITLPDNKVEKTNVERVQGLIDALPMEINSDNKQLVIEANEAYDKLTLDEKKLINDSKLIDALIKLEELLNSEAVPEGVTIISLDMSNAIVPVKNKYAQNGTITVDGKEFFASSYYMKGGLTIGNTDSKNFDVPLDKFGLAGTGSYIEQKFVLENIKSIDISITKIFANFESWHLFFTEEGSTTPVELLTGKEDSLNVSYSFTEAKSGSFTFVVKGFNSRAMLGEIKIGVLA